MSLGDQRYLFRQDVFTGKAQVHFRTSSCPRTTKSARETSNTFQNTKMNF